MAEPDIDHLRELMRRVWAKPDEAAANWIVAHARTESMARAAGQAPSGFAVGAVIRNRLLAAEPRRTPRRATVHAHHKPTHA